eukprot:8485160-Pyramimonas_sp.AAC.1
MREARQVMKLNVRTHVCAGAAGHRGASCTRVFSDGQPCVRPTTRPLASRAGPRAIAREKPRL